MYQGMYNLTSSMLTQRRKLDVTGNNMVNLQTAGYKSETLVSETFKETLYAETDYCNGAYRRNIGKTSYIRAAKKTYTDFSDGTLSETGNPLDVALGGAGFFVVRDRNDAVRYTRCGQFQTDENGYLAMHGGEKVLDVSGKEIVLPTDDVVIDEKGVILLKEGDRQRVWAQIRVAAFADPASLQREDDGLFSATETPEGMPDNTQILQGYKENANTDMVENMTDLMSSQRHLQSAAQLLKMYDQIAGKASNDIGRV